MIPRTRLALNDPRVVPADLFFADQRQIECVGDLSQERFILFAILLALLQPLAPFLRRLSRPLRGQFFESVFFLLLLFFG